LRQQAREKHHALLIVEDASAKLKAEVGVWEQRPDTLPLMQRLKEQLDPEQILNPRCFDF
jgi:FAD/FMN-containing dehydrogenase